MAGAACRRQSCSAHRGSQRWRRTSLLRCLLQSDPLTEVGFERLLANIRSGDADGRRGGAHATKVARLLLRRGPAVFDQRVRLFAGRRNEADRAQRLRASLEQALACGTRMSPRCGRSAVGAYFPLHTLAERRRCCERSWPQSRTRFARPAGRGTGGGTPASQATIPGADRDRRRGIARGAPAIRGKPLSALGQGRRRRSSTPCLSAASPGQILDVLIAGCGTGLSAIELRATSARRAHPRHRSEPRQSQLRQAHGAEISASPISNSLRPTSRGRPRSAAAFDFIDASGVLHHLADPWEGWRALLSLLRPGGDHAGRPLQRTGAPERRRGAGADRRARLSADPGRHPAMPRGDHGGRRRFCVEVGDPVRRISLRPTNVAT